LERFLAERSEQVIAVVAHGDLLEALTGQDLEANINPNSCFVFFFNFIKQSFVMDVEAVMASQCKN
jgi:hypothetical protein